MDPIRVISPLEDPLPSRYIVYCQRTANEERQNIKQKRGSRQATKLMKPMPLTNCSETCTKFKVGEFVQSHTRNGCPKLVFSEVLQKLSGTNMNCWLTRVSHKR